jgi:hypothetical protein
MRKSIKLASVAVGIITLSGLCLGAKGSPPVERFTCGLNITGPANAFSADLGHPTVEVLDGQDSAFITGSEAPVLDLGGPTEYVPYGIEVKVKVHRVNARTLQVSLSASHTSVRLDGTSDLVFSQTGTRRVKAIAAGDTLAVDFGGGCAVRATVTPVSAK